MIARTSPRNTPCFRIATWLTAALCATVPVPHAHAGDEALVPGTGEPSIYSDGTKNRIVFDNPAPAPEPEPLPWLNNPADAPRPNSRSSKRILLPTSNQDLPQSVVVEDQDFLTEGQTSAPSLFGDAPLLAQTSPAQAQANEQIEAGIQANERLAAEENAEAQVVETPGDDQAAVDEAQPTSATPAPEPGLGESLAESAAAEPAASPPEKAFEVLGIEGSLPSPTAEGTDVLTEAEGLDLIGDGDGPSMPPSQSVTVNLIKKLVARGILTEQDAKEMIRQAEAEAEVARAQAQADMFAVAQIAAIQAAADQIAIDQALAAPSEDDLRVTYIPDPVRTQIKEDIKSELLAESGVRPFGHIAGLPSWVNRVHPFGDLRVRFEGIWYPQGNDNTGAFPNFNAINTGLPFDVTGNEFAPQLNADQDRYRYRLRARLGLGVDVTENITMGLRIATGNDNSPVSTNQTLGASGGQFSKYQIWLDRAFLKYQLWGETRRNFEIWVGRFDNPFLSTDLIWDDDLGFDGIGARLVYEVLPGFRPFITGGAFPVYNTDLNFSSNQPAKFKSYDKYLFGVQGGFQWAFAKNWTFATGVAYYHFHNIEGRLSSPFTPLTRNDAGDTDNSRPSFAQKGNTYFPIRNIVPDATNDFGAINQWQYYGLATKFQELAVTARLDYTGFEPVVVSLIGEYVNNLAWNKDEIDLIAVNNRGAIDPEDIDDIFGTYDGSNYAWIVKLQVGHPDFSRRWNWNTSFSYRWIGSDAVVDGFNDSDFGLGGTNMQGYVVGGGLAIAPNVWLGARWMGARSIAGPPFDVNIFQFDLNGKF